MSRSKFRAELCSVRGDGASAGGVGVFGACIQGARRLRGEGSLNFPFPPNVSDGYPEAATTTSEEAENVV